MPEYRSEWINFEEEEKKSQERIKAALDIKVTGASINRLESISNNFSKSQFNDGFGLLSDDVEWMIERLQRYEEALKEITEIDLTWDEPLPTAMRRLAKEALKDEIT